MYDAELGYCHFSPMTLYRAMRWCWCAIMYQLKDIQSFHGLKLPWMKACPTEQVQLVLPRSYTVDRFLLMCVHNLLKVCDMRLPRRFQNELFNYLSLKKRDDNTEGKSWSCKMCYSTSPCWLLIPEILKSFSGHNTPKSGLRRLDFSFLSEWLITSRMQQERWHALREIIDELATSLDDYTTQQSRTKARFT